MKNIFLIFVAILLIGFASCRKTSFLDNQSTASLNQAVTFADSANTMDFLAGLYIDIGNDFITANNMTANNTTNSSPYADEAEGRYPAGGNLDKIITMGTFGNAIYTSPQSDYSMYYADIRKINIFLANVDKSPLSAAKKVRVKAEVRFLRAYYYFILTRYFGGVPLVGDKIFDIAEPGTYIRSFYEDCVKYELSELDAIAPDLPLSYTGLDYGRITQGADLALKSRILLYAASPLFNGGSTAPAENTNLVATLSYPTYDKNRWETARLAAKAVMDLNVYSLNTDNTTKWAGKNDGLGYGFYKVFITRVNNEFILSRPLPNGKAWESLNNPKSRGGSGYFHYPTQELVDRFPTINGKPITTDIKSVSNPTGYDAANPYVNRDPRFTATVIFNGSKYYLNSTKILDNVFTYVGAPSDGIVGISSNTATITGYYVRKMCDENAAVTGGNNVDRCLPIIRYAEILLNYAEATNEMGNATDAINTLKLLRIRAGITPGADGMYGLPSTTDPDVARAVIRNERAIELAFEQHRFWDIRRWKAGAELDGIMLHGMSIVKTGANYTYNIIPVRTRYFKEIYYYWPYSKDDVTFNPLVLQNPGW